MNCPLALLPTALVCALALLGCPQPPPPEPPDDTADASTADASTSDASTPDASTSDASTPDAGSGGADYEWDGGYVELEEKGNWPEDSGPLAPCTVIPEGAIHCDSRSFDLSACNTDSLVSMPSEGVHLLSIRVPLGSDAFVMGAQVLSFTDGGTPLLMRESVTEERVGNARVLYSHVTHSADGGYRRTAIATCQTTQAPAFNGCYASCRNGRSTSRGTFQSERLQWRAGESESSGLELVSESFVDLGVPADVYVTRGHAYVVSLNLDSRPGGLTVFDVRNPAAPVKVKTVQFTADNYWNGVWAKDHALYVASANQGVLVFDISDPANPQFKSSLASGYTNNHTLFVDGNRLYATVDNAVVLFDITDPLAPRELNRYTADDGYSAPHDMFARGDRLYVNFGYVGYLVVDVSDPFNLITLGHFNYDDDQYSHANAVGTFAGRTLSFMGGEGPGEHLRVLDVTEPAAIKKLGRFQLRPALSIHNMVLVGKKLYVSWYQEGVRVLDVSNPTEPKQTAYYNTFRETDPGRGHYYEGAIGIRVPGDGFIYAVDTSRGLLLLRER